MTGQIERAHGFAREASALFIAATCHRMRVGCLPHWRILKKDPATLQGGREPASRGGTDPDDYYARFALADLLLAQNRWSEVEPVLQDIPRTESVLMRLAESQAALHVGEPNPYLVTLVDRLDAARARGERIHARDLASVQLRLLENRHRRVASSQRELGSTARTGRRALAGRVRTRCTGSIGHRRGHRMAASDVVPGRDPRCVAAHARAAG